METITKKMLQNKFELFCKLYGYKIATQHNEPNTIFLDYVAEYGGYQIRSYLCPGEGNPFGHGRHSKSVMFEMLDFACNVEFHKQDAKRTADYRASNCEA